jgi:bacterioferritin-associated ferredoxin
VYACICHAVTETELSDAIDGGASTEEEVGNVCGAGTGCGSCLDRICDALGARYPMHGRARLRAAG